MQDQSTGHWWLVSDVIRVGYWPKELFNHLNSGATKVRYGGTTMTDVLSPPMGSGEFPNGDYKFVCYMLQVKIVNSGFKLIDIIESAMSRNADVPKCYDVHATGFQGSNLGETLAFGGPGGDCGT